MSEFPVLFLQNDVYFMESGIWFDFNNTVAGSSAARQRLRSKQLHNGRYKAAACKKQHKDSIFHAVRAKML